MKHCVICNSRIEGEAEGFIADANEELPLCSECCDLLDALESDNASLSRHARETLTHSMMSTKSMNARAFLCRTLMDGARPDNGMAESRSSKHENDTKEERMETYMENQFCNHCGMLMSECTCGAKAAMTAAPVQPVQPVVSQTPAARTETPYISRFRGVALTQDEEVVRHYNIGEFDKKLGGSSKGSASLIITNKRVISLQDSEYMGTSHISMEELTLDCVTGVKNFYSQGYTVWRVAAAVLFASCTLMMLASGQILLALLWLAGAVYMAYTSRKPSYLFSVYASTVNCAMEMGVNLRGKLFGSGGNGIVFQFKPTKEALNMMHEMGACIMDLKTQGNFAISKWKRVG